jgi:hypothetical protein
MTMSSQATLAVVVDVQHAPLLTDALHEQPIASVDVEEDLVARHS